MTPQTAIHRPRSARLAVEPLEDRATPATAAYAALTQTLTITAHEGDQLVIAPIPNKPTGYLAITETQHAATVFNSDAANKAVRSLVVKFGNVQSGGLTLNADARLGGGLWVYGANFSQSMDILGSVGGNLVYTPAPMAAFEDIDIESSAHVGGNLTLKLGDGENTARLKGGLVRGNLLVTGGTGIDQVELTESANLSVGGSAAIQLGEGANTVVGRGLANTIRVGTTFAYTGGTGIDTFNLDGSGTALQTGADVRVTLGTRTGFDVNRAEFEALTAGRNVAFTGGLGQDTVTISGALNVGGGVAVNLGEGDNRFDSNLLGEGTNSIGLGFNYLGGSGGDAVLLDVASVGRNVNVALGENAGAGQTFTLGGKGPAGVSVYGDVKVTGGSGVDNIGFQRLYVGGSLTVLAGAGHDFVLMDDLDVAGTTRIDLGLGDDLFALETLGGLTRISSFGGKFNVVGGDGNDTVNLSDDGSAATAARFGSLVSLVGGTGLDSVRNEAGNVYEVTGNRAEFEAKAGAAFI